jgi:hypothetical protein
MTPARAGSGLAVVIARLGRRAGAFFVCLIFFLLPVGAQTPSPSPPPVEKKASDQNNADSETGFHFGGAPRLPAANRPLGFQRPMERPVVQRPGVQRPMVRRSLVQRPVVQRPMRPRPAPRMTRRGADERHSSIAKRPRTATPSRLVRQKADAPSRKTTHRSTISEHGADGRKGGKPAAIEKPKITPVGVEQPAKRPDSPAGLVDRAGQFDGKPNAVAHNPLHDSGSLGSSADHKALIIEKYGKYYTRNYYKATIDNRPVWYWYDTPSPVAPPDGPPGSIPVCSGDTDDCPRPTPPTLAVDQPKLPDQKEKPNDGEKKEQKKLTLAETVEELCPGGKVVAGHAYSQCVGGFWHVVSYDTFFCPSNESYKRLKTLDLPTTQPCTQVYEPGGDLINPKGDCQRIVPDPDAPPVVVITCVDNRIQKGKWSRAHCEPGGELRLDKYMEHVPVNPPEDCESGEGFKPKLDEKYDGKPITDLKPEEDKPDKSKP